MGGILLKTLELSPERFLENTQTKERLKVNWMTVITGRNVASYLRKNNLKSVPWMLRRTFGGTLS